MVAVGSGLDTREEDSEPCRVMDFRCRVLLRSARKPGWTLRLGLGDVGTCGTTAAAGCSQSSACVSRVLSLRLGRVGGGAFFTDALPHCCG